MIEEIILICFFVLVVGACIGSFLNVVALRAISKESIVLPASKCPKCNEPIKWYDNIPVLSYLFAFKGKCRNCKEKVSIQYPIVEALTAVLFLAMFLAFGPTVKTLLLCILLSISIVITITDFLKGYVFSVHSWILIAMSIIASLTFNGLHNYSDTVIGLIVGVFVMELIAKASYYLVRKNEPQEEKKSEETEVCIAENITEEKTEDSEDEDINEYVKKNKRAFGEGDTYLAAAVGALLGWKYLLVAISFSIILQAICILPQFLIGLYKQKAFKLLISLTSFIILAAVYLTLSNMVTLPLAVVFTIVIALIFFGFDSIIRLKNTTNEQGFVGIPFGPALLCSMFIILFWGEPIISFIKKHIFMILG